MPSGSAKKQGAGHDSAQKNSSNNSGRSGSSTPGGGRARKRKRCEVRRFSESDLESEFEDCNLEDAVEIENKLRKVAKDNHLTDEEMRRLLQKFVKNEHILALVTLQAEDELARERQESSEQPAIIITDIPSVPKLTRSKARELNKTPGITLSTISSDSKEPEIAALIQEELHPDEDDEEYVFKEEDFASDEDNNTSASDMDSNPRTPQTPLSQIGESPVKLTADGCFKIPLEIPKGTPVREDVRIAARTRSKLCLQQTAIEDLESEFVPPDVEQIDLQDMDLAANDEDWWQFLNDFTKPLNSSFITDDDDPINDPEYVAAERITEDAEELRNINIPKNELTELVAELFEGLINEGVSLESVELDTPQKFLESSLNQTNTSDGNNISYTAAEKSNEIRSHVTRQLNFDNAATPQRVAYEAQQAYINDVPPLIPINSSTNITQNCYTFQPNIMSTPASSMPQRAVGTTASQLQIPVSYSNSPEQEASQVVTLPNTTIGLNADPEWIAVKIPGQHNSYQLARVVPAANAFGPPPLVRIQPQKTSVSAAQPEAQQTPQTPVEPPSEDTRYSVPYDTNFTWEYISIRKHVYTEYRSKFEKLRSQPNNAPPAETEEELTDDRVGFTKYQHDLLQQQLRIHVQMLTQTFLQSYSHPIYWKFAPKVKDMLTELEKKSEDDASFRAWNLKPAMQLITQWEDDLKQDTPENKEMMKFIHKEIQLTNRNCRQVVRFPARIMDLVLNSKVFMYPKYLPRIPFISRRSKYEAFSPAEEQLLAMGLERHIKRIRESGERISKKTTELKKAVLRLAKDTVFGKSARRIWAQLKTLRNADYYNPVKYYFEHKRAPPVEHELITFANNRVYPPKSRYKQLPLAWQSYLDDQRRRNKVAKVSEIAGASYLQFVREALGEDIQLPDSGTEAVTPNGNESASSWFSETRSIHCKNKSRYKNSFANSVTINVNYNFSAATVTNSVPQTPTTNAGIPSARQTRNPITIDQDLPNTSDSECIPLQNNRSEVNTDIVSFNFDWRTKTLQPIIEAPTNNQDSAHTPKSQRVSVLRGVGNTPVRRKLRYPKSKNTPKRTQASHYWTVQRSNRLFARYQKRRRQLRKRFLSLLNNYREHLKKKELPYKNTPIVLRVFRYFRALELYTNLLGELEMACRNAANTAATGSGSAVNEQQSVNKSANAAAPQQQHSPTAKFYVHTSQSSYFGKRTRAHLVQQQQQHQALDDDANAASRSKKVSRQEENFRHMLLPNTAEDANRKDAIYAFNFYEKVEEALKASNRAEDCKRFNHILKTFDPLRDKVSDLYYKLERLFLPEHPELAEVFLTFLLPSEAAEIGKFFEHFMINNMTTFINKLNIYFNKQPAQIRKIYNSLAELAEDPEVTMKKVEAKILPLLKGNQFLTDWFLQQFTEAKPPERLFTATEHVNLKEVEIRPNLYESLNEPNDSATTCCEIQQQQQQPQPQQQPLCQTNTCQLKYINGRIFYGNKMTLPAKLSFMATNNNTQINDINDCDMEDLTEQATPECVHGIREHGEKRLAAAVDKAAAANAAAADCSSDDNERSEEEDVSKALIIDTANEDDSSSSMETCDDAVLRAHAMRLNPSYYGNTCFAPLTSTPNTNTNNQISHHHPNAKRSILNFNDDGKAISPRKQLTPGTVTNTSANNSSSMSGMQCLSPNNNGTATPSHTIPTNTAGNMAISNSDGASQISTLQQQRDRRKSPTKKSRSPLSGTVTRTRPNIQPMVVIYERNSAIACAKKLKSLIADEDNEEGEMDNKERLGIVACVKPTTSVSSMSLDTQQDTTNDSSNSAALQQPNEPRAASPHTPPLLTITKVEQVDNSDDMEFLPENAEVTHTLSQACINLQQSTKTVAHEPNESASQSESYTEDCKLDVVATLATSSNTDTSHTVPSNHNTVGPSRAVSTTAWTREEDKLILIEMKLSAGVELDKLFERMRVKLPSRSLTEIKGRYQFLMDFLSKLQGK